jgi:hypothetical protein
LGFFQDIGVYVEGGEWDDSKYHILMNYPPPKNMEVMKSLLTKKLHILSMPWMRDLKNMHLQGKIWRKKLVNRLQFLGKEQESPHDSIRDNTYLI